MKTKHLPSTKPSSNQSGVALLDCLVYLSLLMIVLGLAYAGFYAVFENTMRLNRNAADIVRALQAGDQWREDVRRASGAPKLLELQGQTALHIPQTNGDLVYFFKTNTVLRKAGAAAPVLFLPQVKDSRMEIDQRRHVASWRWEVELQKPGTTSRLKPLFTFQAVPAVPLK